MKALSRLIIGTRCSTGENKVEGGAPTDWVGEPGVTRSGWLASMSRSSRTKASYSASGISGASSWW